MKLIMSTKRLLNRGLAPGASQGNQPCENKQYACTLETHLSSGISSPYPCAVSSQYSAMVRSL
jgi:hypothetical protein